MKIRKRLAETCWIESGDAFIAASWSWPPSRCGSTGVLIVPGIAHEERITADGVAALAGTLCGQGMPTLAIDLHGTAQSAGNLNSDDIGERWREDIRAAARHLRSTGVGQIVVIGVRLGALLAIEALQGEPIAAFVAWSPVVSGRRYLRELKVLQSAGAVEGDSREGELSVAGHVVPAPVRTHLGTLDLIHCAGGSAQRVLLLDAESRLTDRWVERFEQAGSRIDRHASTQVDHWLFGMNERPMIPDTDIQVIAEWCTRLPPALPALPASSAATAPRAPAMAEEVSFMHGGRMIRERVVSIGPVGLSAVLSEPVAAPPSGAVRLLMTMVGPGRMFPDFARDEASRGKTCLRFDFAGFSNSNRRRRSIPGNFYALGNAEDIVDALAHLRASGYRNAVTLGFCAGAWSMIQTGPVQGVAAAAAINVALYRQADFETHELIKRRGHVVSKLISLLRRTRRSSGYADKIERTLKVMLDPIRWLRAYCRSEVPLMLCFGGTDAGLPYLEKQLGSEIDTLQRRGVLSIQRYRGLGHLTEGAEARRKMLLEVSAFFGAIDDKAAVDSPRHADADRDAASAEQRGLQPAARPSTSVGAPAGHAPIVSS